MTPQRKVIVHIGTSADGYIARPDGDIEWLTSRQERGRAAGRTTIDRDPLTAGNRAHLLKARHRRIA